MQSIQNMNHFSSPVQTIYNANNMINEPTDTDHQSLPVRGSTKSTSSSAARSPTTVFAIDELTSVFRVADSTDSDANTAAIEQRATVVARQEKENGGNVLRRSRCLITPSFATDGELSTFSEDSETTTTSSSYSDEEDSVIRFAIRRRRSPLSIFRESVSGTKRRSCEFEDDEEEDDDIDQLVQRARSGSMSNKRPMLCHASPISDSDDDESGHELLSSSYSPLHSSQVGELSSSSPFGSPFKRPCRQEEESHELSASATTLTLSPYSSFFAEASPAAANTTATTTTFPLMPNHLQHPLSFFESTSTAAGSSASAFPIFRANAIKEN